MRCSTFVEMPDRVAVNESPLSLRISRSVNPAVSALKPRGLAMRFSARSTWDDLRTSQSKSLTMKKLSAITLSKQVQGPVELYHKSGSKLTKKLVTSKQAD